MECSFSILVIEAAAKGIAGRLNHLGNPDVEELRQWLAQYHAAVEKAHGTKAADAIFRYAPIHGLR